MHDLSPQFGHASIRAHSAHTHARACVHTPHQRTTQSTSEFLAVEKYKANFNNTLKNGARRWEGYGNAPPCKSWDKLVHIRHLLVEGTMDATVFAERGGIDCCV